MLIVGLTGGIGSGKSTVAALFAALGITVINADDLAREAVAVGSDSLARIAEHFGKDILNSDGSLKRESLRRLVFANPAERVWLEQLLHPRIAELMRQRIAQCSSPYCLIESPLLLETGQHKLADRVLVVDVSEQTQLARTLARDISDEATIRAIIAAQMSREERLRRADDIINNEEGKDQLEAAVATLHTRYMAMSASGKN